MLLHVITPNVITLNVNVITPNVIRCNVITLKSY